MSQGMAKSGNVTGPVSSVDNAIPRYDSTTGTILQGSGVTIDDSNNMSGAASITFSAVGSDPLAYYEEGTFDPAVTISGAGTAPQYTNHEGYYTQIGNRMFVDIELNGDGGNEGSGAGTLIVALPKAQAGIIRYRGLAGRLTNGTSDWLIWAFINRGESYLAMKYQSAIGTFTTVTGGIQNNINRSININFCYIV